MYHPDWLMFDRLRSRYSAKKRDDEVEDEAIIGDIGQAFFLTVPLELLLAAFYILVHMQYKTEVEYGEIIMRSVKSFIPIWVLVAVTHPRRQWRLVQLA